MATPREDNESDSLASLEERVTRAVEIVSTLRNEREQLLQRLAGRPVIFNNQDFLHTLLFEGYTKRERVPEVLVQPREDERQHRLRDARGSRQRVRIRGQALVREQLLDERVQHGSCGLCQVQDERRNSRFRAAIVAPARPLDARRSLRAWLESDSGR